MTADDASSVTSSSRSSEDDDEDDEQPLAQQVHHHHHLHQSRSRTAEEESAAKVLGGLRLARMDVDDDEERDEMEDGQRTPTRPRRSASPVSEGPVVVRRTVPGLKDLLNEVGVEPMRRGRRPSVAAATSAGMDLD